eukprot:scaffold81623_cov60-Phaeocystis_antarctica.AAC.3
MQIRPYEYRILNVLVDSCSLFKLPLLSAARFTLNYPPWFRQSSRATRFRNRASQPWPPTSHPRVLRPFVLDAQPRRVTRHRPRRSSPRRLPRRAARAREGLDPGPPRPRRVRHGQAAARAAAPHQAVGLSRIHYRTHAKAGVVLDEGIFIPTRLFLYYILQTLCRLRLYIGC